MTESELLAMMTAGMATVSGAVLGGYVAAGFMATCMSAAIAGVIS